MSDTPAGSVLDSLRRLLATLVALLATRAELVATELEEELYRAARLLLWAMAALLATVLALALGAATLILAFRESHPALVAGVVAAVFALAALGGWFGVRRQLRDRPPLLAATRGELARDEAALAGTRSPADPPGSPGEGL